MSWSKDYMKTPSGVIEAARAELQQAKARRSANAAELERLDTERAKHIHLIGLLDPHIAEIESWLERVAQEGLPQPIGPEDIHDRADSAMRRR